MPDPPSLTIGIDGRELQGRPTGTGRYLRNLLHAWSAAGTDRLLVYCATLIHSGMQTEEAILAAMIEPLTDDGEVKKALLRVVELTLG